MATVDSLDIQIAAQAKNAEKALDSLVGKLNILSNSLKGINGSGLSNFSKGVNRLSNAMKVLNSVKTTDFNRLTKNIGKLSNLNTQGLNSSANSLSNVTKSLKSLGKVTNNTKQVGNLTRGFVSTSNTVNKTSKSFLSFSGVLSSVYSDILLVSRGFGELYDSIESTADYIEAYNYLNVALGKVGSDWSHQYEQYGYENAEAYANSFSTRLNESFSKLSGVEIKIGTDGKGVLSETGLKNLGLNIQEITQYGAQLASVTNSVGQTGEVSLVAAEAFTKLGADISSLFNMDYSSVMNNLQSGLIGQSRALYKYGIDITNATLQTYAYELGLEKTVTEMTQAEKMQLRMIAILDQSKVSWGDLSKTIESPNNQLRILSNNVKELSLVFGQLFIPVLSKVLPYINGMVIALKRLVTEIAGIMGIELDLSGFGQGYTELEDDISGIEDAYDSATESAKKLKTATLGIDELNINAPEDTSTSDVSGIGGGIDLTGQILDATAEYEKAWNDAYAQMESRAEEFANKIEKYLEPVKKLFKDIKIGDWFEAGQDVSNIVSGIFDLFSKAIEKVNWYELGKNIGNFLAGINWGDIISSSLKTFGEVLKGIFEGYFGSLSVAPLETLTLSFVTLSKINFKKIKKGVKDVTTNTIKLQKATVGITGIFAEFELISDAFKDIGKGTANLSDSIGQTIAGLGIAGASLYSAFGSAALPITVITGLFSALVGLDNAVNEILVERAGNAIKEALTVPGGMTLEDIADKYKNTMSEISESFISIETNSEKLEGSRLNIENIWKEIYNVRNQMDAGVISVEEGTTKINELFKELSESSQGYFSLVVETLSNAFSENSALRKNLEDLGVSVSELTNSLNELKGQQESELESLYEQLLETDPLSEEYDAILQQIEALTTGYSEADKAISQLDFKLENADFGQLIDEETLQLNQQNLDSWIGMIRDTNDEMKNELLNSSAELKATTEEAYSMALALDDEELANDLKTTIEAIEQTYDDETEKLSNATGEFVAELQSEMLNRLSTIIANAKAEGYSDSQIQDIVSKYIEMYDKVGSQVNKELGDSYWNDEISKTLLEDLFYFDTVEVEGYVVSDSNVETVLSDNYEEIIKNAIEQAAENSTEPFENSGKQSVNSYIDGLVLSRSPLVNKTNLLSNDAIKPFKNLESNFFKIGESAIDEMKNGMVLSANGLYDECNKIVSNIQNIFSGATAGITMGLNAVVSKINIPQYAVGGFPEDGLFFANHNELVGQFSNGRTAVANNDQIVSGIKDGVKEAVAEILAPYLADIAQNTRETANKDLSVNIGDKEIYKASVRGQKSYGFQLIT